MHGILPTGFVLGTLRGILAQWGYLALFGFVVLGNLGLPVPENSVLWIAGYFVWTGRLRLPLVLLVGILAAVGGDNLGYWIGRRYGQAAVERYGHWARLTPARLAKMRGFVQRYGTFGVFIARFVTGLRFMAGPLAGSMGLPPLPFLLANVLGAFLYVPVMVGAGYAVGYGFGRSVRRIARAEDKLEFLLVLGVIVEALLWIAVHLGLRIRRARKADVAS